MGIFKKLIVCMLVLTIPCYATTLPVQINYLPTPTFTTPKTVYVTQSGSGSADGSSFANSISVANTLNFTILKPGDTGYVCDEIRYQGDVNGDGIIISATGISGHRIDIRGDCPGHPGIINGAYLLNSANWTSVGSGVYSIPWSSSVLKPLQSGMVIEDDIPLIAIGWAGSSAATITNMINLVNRTSNSSTSNTIGTGSFTFTIRTGLSVTAGINVNISNSTTTFRGFSGTVTSYNSGTGQLVINATSTGGSGTFSSWIVSFETGAWSYDATNHLLYALPYAQDDPSGHVIEASFGNVFTYLIYTSGSYLTFEHLTIKNAGDYGVDMNYGNQGHVSSVDNIVMNNTIKNISNWGIFAIDQTNLQVHDNTFSYLTWAAHAPSGIGHGEGVRFASCIGGRVYSNDFSHDASIDIDLWHDYSNPGVEVDHNTIHDSLDTNLAFAAGIYTDSAWNFKIHDNLIYSKQMGININSEVGAIYSTNGLIYNNIIFNWWQDGLVVGATNGLWTASKSNFFFNNTVTFVVPNNTISTLTVGPSLTFGDSVDDTFKNNIIQQSASIVTGRPSTIQSFTTGKIDYNVYAANFSSSCGGTLSNWQTCTKGDAHSVKPTLSTFNGLTFVSPSGTIDLHLLPATVPVGNGTDLSAYFTTDYDGSTRTVPWDTGAYKH